MFFSGQVLDGFKQQLLALDFPGIELVRHRKKRVSCVLGREING